MILEARKISEEQSLQKKNAKKKREQEKEKASRKSQKLFKPKGKGKLKRIQGFEHQWIGGPTGIKSWPKQLKPSCP